MLVLIGIAVGVFLVVAALTYAGGSRGGKRYRPGRPFSFTPVWFLSAPQRQVAAGAKLGRELTAGSLGAAPHRPRHGETGGASDRW
jgi:hypothetical protein